jgi:hypothetical protein
MHAAANQFQIAMPSLGTAFDAQGQELTWSETRARVTRAADVLEFTLAAGYSQFPPPIQGYLETVRNDIRLGRAEAALASDGWDFAVRTAELWNQGQTAFGYAGDLVGMQCGVQLGADRDTMLFPFMTTTTVS